MAKLVAIGDSITQGFQSGAIYRADWSFPAIIARSMGLDIPTEFRVPRFPGSGLPLNIEQALRWMQPQLGPNINLSEWIVQFPLLLGQFIDDVEDLYERGAGSRPASYGGVYHNLAVWGFRVADSFRITPEYCRSAIYNEEGWIENDFLGLPAAPMYRTALKVLNPKWRDDRMSWTQLGNLQHIVEQDRQLESLILWLGANDCLGTVTDLKLKDMDSPPVTDDPVERSSKWNLTHPEVFAEDFERLVAELKATIPDETKVFVGTLGHVTIPPVTQGIPPYQGKYFKYYGRFFANESNFNPYLHRCLTGEQAQQIDARIDNFNETIKKIVNKQGKNWHIVYTGEIMDTLAVKRNGMTNVPERPLINYYAQQGISDHPLLRLAPVPNALRLSIRNGKRETGGLFSLDCVHPSTIGYGIIAEAFLNVMRDAEVDKADPTRLNWGEIIAQDTLLQAPPLLWKDIVATSERNATLWNVIFSVM